MYTARWGFIAILEKKMIFKRYFWWLALSIFALACRPAVADMYKCKTVAGQTTFQDTPCLVGAETVIGPRTAAPESTDASIARISKSIDDELARRTERSNANWEKLRPQREAAEEAQAKELPKFYKEQEQRKATLLLCVKREKNSDCTASTYRTLLVGMHQSDVDDIFGDARTQMIGGSELHYYSAPIFEGRTWRGGRLQISYGAPRNVPIGARGLTNRVTEVNVY
jgi:hypothetical protein